MSLYTSGALTHGAHGRYDALAEWRHDMPGHFPFSRQSDVEASLESAIGLRWRTGARANDAMRFSQLAQVEAQGATLVVGYLPHSPAQL